jgi:hypothetical protein
MSHCYPQDGFLLNPSIADKVQVIDGVFVPQVHVSIRPADGLGF